MAKVEKIREFISEEEIKNKVLELSKLVTDYYKGEPVKMICILKGAVMFMVDLAKNVDLPVMFDFMSVSSYGSSTVSSGTIKILKDLDAPIEGQNVLIVEDIVDSGRTLYHLQGYLERKNPKSINICTLFDKPDRREFDVNVKWSGFKIPDEFIVGYGLDYDERYRSLPYIGILSFEEE
ncbi:MAG: hypoxanthine phosphoribosyltransferase [Lachnospirales bacterium]